MTRGIIPDDMAIRLENIADLFLELSTDDDTWLSRDEQDDFNDMYDTLTGIIDNYMLTRRNAF